MLTQIPTKLAELSRQHRENGYDHAYYAIPVLIGFFVTWCIIQIWVRLLPRASLSANGYHIHHYTYGIAILIVFGYISLFARSPRLRYICALAHGVGAAFIIDEAFIWFTLNPGPGGSGYQDYDLIVFVVVILLTLILTPVFFRWFKDGK